MLAAIDNFYRSLGADRPDVAREDLPQLAPRALEEDEQRRFLRAVEASGIIPLTHGMNSRKLLLSGRLSL